MDPGIERLLELKCGDCIHCKLSGWWDPQHVCELSGFPITRGDGACISIEEIRKSNDTSI